MRTAHLIALDTLAWIICCVGAVAATVTALTHPAAFDIHRQGLFLDAFAATLGLAVLLMLDRATDRLASATWRRGEPELCATCGELLDDADGVVLVHAHHTQAVHATSDAEF